MSNICKFDGLATFVAQTGAKRRTKPLTDKQAAAMAKTIARLGRGELTVSMSGVERKPGRCGGRVTIAGARVEPWYIVSRFLGGNSTEHLAADYAVTVAQVEAAIRFELSRTKRLRWFFWVRKEDRK